MVLGAGDDRDIHRLDDWTMCFAGAINPVDERGKHSGPLMVFLPLEVLFNEPIGESLRIFRRGNGRGCQSQKEKERGDLFDSIPSLSKEF